VRPPAEVVLRGPASIGSYTAGAFAGASRFAGDEVGYRSGRTGSPRKRLRAHALRGFKSHPHRAQIAHVSERVCPMPAFSERVT
jgi:hypothetical protein